MYCGVSVDLDEVECYAAIHGVATPADAAHAVYRKALPRFVELFEALSIPATFFVIGRDLEHAHARQAVADLAQRGHEIGNHTFHHRYDFTRQPVADMQRDIDDGAEAIARACGVSPVGFRAPGYTIVDATFEHLQARGYRYDSSVFPCPPYYSAKALALGAIRARGRKSHSVLDDPRVLSAPADPYRVGRPYYRRGKGLLELPIGVTKGASLRLPYIGTSLALLSTQGAAWLTRRILGRPLVNLELHGIDLCDATEDGLQGLVPHQPDLRRTLADKRAALQSAIWTLRGAGYELVTLAQAAEHF